MGRTDCSEPLPYRLHEPRALYILCVAVYCIQMSCVGQAYCNYELITCCLISICEAYCQFLTGSRMQGLILCLFASQADESGNWLASLPIFINFLDHQWTPNLLHATDVHCMLRKVYNPKHNYTCSECSALDAWPHTATSMQHLRGTSRSKCTWVQVLISGIFMLLTHFKCTECDFWSLDRDKCNNVQEFNW